MKMRSSHLAFLILAVLVVIVALAALSNGGPGKNANSRGGTDTFLAQVEQIRDTGGGSAVKDGIIPSAADGLSKRGKLEFSENPVNMGTIPNQGFTTKGIQVRNTGTLAIEISEIQTSCHCTEGAFERASVRANGKRVTTIEPGKEETLTVRLDPRRVQGFEAHKVLTLITNDPVTYQYELPVDTHVDPEYEVEPKTIDFGTVQRGATPEVRMKIRQLTADPFDVTRVELLNPDKARVLKGAQEVPVTFDLAKMPETEWKTPGRAEWEVTARLSPLAPVGAIAEKLVVLSTAPRVPAVDFDVVGTVETFYTTEPDNLGSRDAVVPGQARVAKMTVTGKAPITVADATVSGQGLLIEVVQQSDPNKADVFVSVASDASPGLKNETVTFMVSGNGQSVQHTARAYVSVQSKPAAAQ